MTAPTHPWPRRSVDELMNAYEAWPGSAHDKGKLLAVVLRNRIEAVVVCIPPTVLAVAPDSSKVERRLMATVGQPGLTRADQDRRLAVVQAVVATYNALCDLLHGRQLDAYPPQADLHAWTKTIEALEVEW